MPADALLALHAVGAGKEEKPVTDLIAGLFAAGLVDDARDLVPVNKRIGAFPGVCGQVRMSDPHRPYRHDFQDKAVRFTDGSVDGLHADVAGSVHQCRFHLCAHTGTS
jgi:hypothetical protein